MNSLIIKGRITADPELKNTDNAVEYCDFTVAVDRYAGKDKERETDFIPCRTWQKTAVFVSQYFKKGQEILVNGELQVNKYEKDGEKRTYSFCRVNKAEFCGSKQDVSQTTNTQFTDLSGTDDDLPF